MTNDGEYARNLFVIILAILIFPSPIPALSAPDLNAPLGTRVVGMISGDITWDLVSSPFWIEGYTELERNASLTILAGVEVFFNGPFLFVSNGNLSFDGDQGKPVRFALNRTGFSDRYTIWSSDGLLRISNVIIHNGRLQIDGPSDAKVSDLEIRCDLASLITTDSSIDIQRTRNAQFHRISIAVTGTPKFINGFTGFSNEGLLLDSFRFSGSQPDGINLGCTACTLSNGTLLDLGTTGVHFEGNSSSLADIRIDGSNQALHVGGNGNIIQRNALYSPQRAIIIKEGCNNLIANNTILGPSYDGIVAFGTWVTTSGNVIFGNKVNGATHIGIGLIHDTPDPTLSDGNFAILNNVEGSETGILLESSDHTVYGNVLVGNGVGISASGSSNRIFHNHLTDNIQQALDPGVANQWDDGYPSGGNWWSDYVGVDINHGQWQNIPGSDGIGDSPYTIDADSKDNFPFYYMPLPFPPRQVTARADGFPGDITIDWEPPPLLSNGRYLIYSASTPTGFDFSTPNATVDVPLTTWSDPGAAFTPGPKYYVVRALNLTSGATSPTSNTAGKWTHTFATGLSTFALPLSPYPWIDYSQPSWVDTVQDFLFNTGATSVAYMAAGRWVEIPGPGDPDHRLELGEGYAVQMAGLTSYTFVGLPASMISYMESPPLWYAGFGQDDARRIWATAFDSDVRVSWIQPPGMMSMRDSYRVYYSPTRDGFFGIEGLDYLLLGGAPIMAPWGPVANAYHSGAFSSGHEWYYMVVPYVNNSLQGSSSYSVGVISEEIAPGYSAIGLPLRPWANGTFLGVNVSSISSADILGVQWLDPSRNDWVARQAWMPPGMYDAPLLMVMAVQVDASVATTIAFTGV
jgi:parallel beta-helix repeat protein